jgi:hypothetical protein
MIQAFITFMINTFILLAILFWLLALFSIVMLRQYFKKRKQRQIALLRQFHNRLFTATSEILSKAEQIDLASKYVTDKSPNFDKSVRLTCSELVVLTDRLQSMKLDIDRGQIKMVRGQMLSCANVACRLARELNSISYVQDIGRL